MKIEDVKPRNENVLVEIEKLDEVVGNVYVGNQNAVETDAHPTEFYIAKILKYGTLAADKDQCPEIDDSKYALFTEWAGKVIATEDGYTKVIPGYNIVALSKSLEMKKEDLEATCDRILVELVQEEKEKDGIFIDVKDDPREGVTQKGRVLSCAKGADQYEVGTIVLFDPAAGNLIVNRPGEQLKTLNSRSILCTI